MPEFISKLQYKTYEKGEFSDEKVRTLDETLQLIKSFPWEEQRGADVQLTGPSVTIQDDYLNYLKVGLYFNGKFCLYYLDSNNHLYECHADDLNTVYKLIIDFFERQLDLCQFEKHLFSLGSKSHFENGVFDYAVKKTIMILYILMTFFFACLGLIGTVTFFKIPDMPKPFILLPLFIGVFCSGTFYFLVKIYSTTKGMSLSLSQGNSHFQVWQNDVMAEHEKGDIAALNVYGQTGRSSRVFNLMELVFKDGTSIIVPGTLIDPFSFILKFPGISPNYKGGYFLTSGFFWNYSK